MKIDGIEIHNFRGFSNTKVKFERDINVFISENAAGKSSFLEAILKSLYSLTQELVGTRSQEHNKLDFTIDDINHLHSQANLLLNIEYKGEKYNLSSNVLNYSSEHINGGLNQNKNDVFEIEKYKLVDLIRQGLKTDLNSLPIIKFYPATRNSIKTSLNNSEIYVDDKLLESWANIYQNEKSFNRFFDWFFEHETSELRYQRDQNNFNIELPELKYVREAVKQALKKLSGLSYEIKSDQFKFNNSNKLVRTIKLETHKNGHIISDRLENKSDGEKSIISLVADIAYNLSIANRLPEFNYLNSEGIVLIDEIGAHLHPKWQRKIIPILREIFPNIQFFITTHSPQVISSIESSKIFLMENFTVTKFNFKTKGVDTNTLLHTVFNTNERPQNFIVLLEEFDSKIENKAKAVELQEIIDQIKKLFNDDPGSTNTDSLITELQIRLEAYKFDLENEIN